MANRLSKIAAEEWLEREIKKDQLQIEANKKILIEEIKKLDKSVFNKKDENKKLNFWDKIKIVINHGKNG